MRSAIVRAAMRRGCVCAMRVAAELEADLRQLRRLARAGRAGDDHDLVVADGARDLVPRGADGQLRRVGDDGFGAGIAFDRTERWRARGAPSARRGVRARGSTDRVSPSRCPHVDGCPHRSRSLGDACAAARLGPRPAAAARRARRARAASTWLLIAGDTAPVLPARSSPTPPLPSCRRPDLAVAGGSTRAPRETRARDLKTSQWRRREAPGRDVSAAPRQLACDTKRPFIRSTPCIRSRRSAEPARRRIIDILASGEHTAGDARARSSGRSSAHPRQSRTAGPPSTAHSEADAGYRRGSRRLPSSSVLLRRDGPHHDRLEGVSPISRKWDSRIDGMQRRLMPIRGGLPRASGSRARPGRAGTADAACTRTLHARRPRANPTRAG